MPANFFLYEDVFGVSPEVTITAIKSVLNCPVCGELFSTEEEMWEHVKTAHPWHWHFWYAPHGKPLLALTGVSVVGIVIVGVSKAFPPVLKR